MDDKELNTARLLLRPLRPDDADERHALWTAPGVRRYLWDDEIIAPERTADVIAESERLFATEGYGLCAARQHGSEALVGFGGYWYFHEPYGDSREHRRT